MEKISSFNTIAFMLITCCCSSCNSEIKDIEISVLEDITDTLLVQPSSADIFAAANIDSTSLERIHITFSTISDYHYNAIYGANIPNKSLLLSNPTDRAGEIAAFRERVSGSIALINKGNRRPQSNICATVLRELNRLALVSAKQKICIVYSDLAENTSTFSVYRSADMSLLEADPDKVKRILTQNIQPGDLSGIRVYLIFKAANTNDDLRFTHMSALYKEILTKAGAEVSIGANLISTE